MQLEIPPQLLSLIDDPRLSDVLISPEKTEIDLGSGLEEIDPLFETELEVSKLARSLIELGGRRLDQANPFSDVSLPGGLRVHAVLASSCSPKTLVSIRLHQIKTPTLEELLETGFLSFDQLQLLNQISAQRQSFLIAGATSTGKTTLLRSMLANLSERIIAIEDVTELTGPNIISLQTRAPNVEGSGEITLGQLVREALRMRPDRIVIGEVRSTELIVMLQALNTGHRGATTIHANELAAVPARLRAIAQGTTISDSALNQMILAAFDWVIGLEASQGKRKLSSIGKFSLEGQSLSVVPTSGGS